MSNPLLPPPEVIASWPPRNTVNPESRGPGLVYSAAILASFGVIVISARVYSRVFISKVPGIDDALIVFATLTGLALTALVIVANVKYHLGFHIWDIDPRTAEPHRLIAWISQWCYLSSTTAIKISVLLFYRRLSYSFTPAFLWATWAGIIYNIGQFVAFGISLLLVCTPVDGYWRIFDREARLEGRIQCRAEGLPLTLSAVFSIIGDFYAALLPSLLVFRLKMPRKQKTAVAALFALGYLTVGAGIARAVTTARATINEFDYTFFLWDVWIWSLLELWLGVSAASAPALKPFCKRFLLGPLSTVMGTFSQHFGRQRMSSRSKLISSNDVEKGVLSQSSDSTSAPTAKPRDLAQDLEAGYESEGVRTQKRVHSRLPRKVEVGGRSRGAASAPGISHPKPIQPGHATANTSSARSQPVSHQRLPSSSTQYRAQGAGNAMRKATTSLGLIERAALMRPLPPLPHERDGTRTPPRSGTIASGGSEEQWLKAPPIRGKLIDKNVTWSAVPESEQGRDEGRSTSVNQQKWLG